MPSDPVAGRSPSLAGSRAGESLRILVVDESTRDREMLRDALTAGLPGCRITLLVQPAELTRSLDATGCDVVITDHRPGWVDAFELLAAVRQRDPDLPILFCTGAGSEELAVAAMKAGFDDYVLKHPHHFPRLVSAVRSALEESARRRVAREAETRYRTLFEGVPVGLFRATLTGQVLDANPALIRLLGFPSRESLMAVNLRDIHADTKSRQALPRAARARGRGPGRRHPVETLRRADHHGASERPAGPRRVRTAAPLRGCRRRHHRERTSAPRAARVQPVPAGDHLRRGRGNHRPQPGAALHRLQLLHGEDDRPQAGARPGAPLLRRLPVPAAARLRGAPPEGDRRRDGVLVRRSVPDRGDGAIRMGDRDLRAAPQRRRADRGRDRNRARRHGTPRSGGRAERERGEIPDPDRARSGGDRRLRRGGGPLRGRERERGPPLRPPPPRPVRGGTRGGIPSGPAGRPPVGGPGAREDPGGAKRRHARVRVDAPRRAGPRRAVRDPPRAPPLGHAPARPRQRHGHLGPQAIRADPLRAVSNRRRRQLRRGHRRVLRGDPRDRRRAHVREELLRRAPRPGHADAVLSLLRRRVRRSARAAAAAPRADRAGAARPASRSSCPTRISAASWRPARSRRSDRPRSTGSASP